MSVLRNRPLIVLAVALLAGCQENGSDGTLPAIDPESIVVAPTEIRRDSRTQLLNVEGLGGLIANGDELLVMVFDRETEEGKKYLENRASAIESMHRQEGKLVRSEDPAQEFLRVPDDEDESSSRIYYFQRKNDGHYEYVGVCAGAWRDDPDWPPICEIVMAYGDRYVSIEVEESAFLQNYESISKRVLDKLAGG